MIKFRSLHQSDFPLIHIWFNEPHVQEFYSLRNWTLSEVESKFKDNFEMKTDVKAYIVTDHDVPFGYMQYYPVKNHPWEGQNFTQEIIDSAAGIDYFIGNKAYLHKGFGRQMIELFIKDYLSLDFQYCIADPSKDNAQSIILLEKIGFELHQDIKCKDALGRDGTYQLMIKRIPPSIVEQQFENNIIDLYGEAGANWLEELNNHVTHLSRHWALTEIKPISGMTYNYVATALYDNTPVVLKMGYDRVAIIKEALVLELFEGNGMVDLIDAHPSLNAFLIACANPGISLKQYQDDFDLVIRAYAEVFKRLEKQSAIIGNLHQFPHLRDLLQSIDSADPALFPKGMIEKGIALMKTLLEQCDKPRLLHGDLHLDNILSNKDTWVAIDPKGVIGDSYFEAAWFDFINETELNRQDAHLIFNARVNKLSDALSLHSQRLKDWIFIRLLLAACWNLEDHGTPGKFLNIINRIF